MKWAKLIKDLRDKLFLSQTEMAELLGVSFATVNRWENSKNEPTIKVKRKIKELCDQNGINMDVYSE
jgi:DNA-binding XRE family transcriptional regulator